MPKKISFEQFVDDCGSQEKAARKIGVTLMTVYRWTKDKTRPVNELILQRLEELGIDTEKFLNDRID